MSNLFKRLLLLLIPGLMFSLSVKGDDTEVYVDLVNLSDEEIAPNIMLILDNSGSMRGGAGGTSNYNSDVSYAGSENYTGGAGDDQYYYLYRRYSGSYKVYVNKVHQSNIDSSCTTVATGISHLQYVQYDADVSAGENWQAMCDDRDEQRDLAACLFDPSPTGHAVQCLSSPGTETVCNRHGENCREQEIAPDDTTHLYFVSANHHNYLQSYYRINVMKKAVKDMMDDIYVKGGLTKVALMNFNAQNGGKVIQEFVDATDLSHSTSIKQSVDLMEPGGFTPLAETLWEAGNYFRGLAPDYSGSNAESQSGGQFISPIQYECQKNHLVLLTDGAPRKDNESDSKITAITPVSRSIYSDYACESPDDGEIACFPRIANWLYHTDHSTGSAGGTHSSGVSAGARKNLPGTQNITVYTVGLDLDTKDLKDAASNTDGNAATSENYYSPSSATDLSSALTSILDQVEFETDTFVAPAVAVNAYNGLQHRDELYFALFQPGSTPRWTGNIKKYKLEDGILVDATGKAATNSEGFFSSDSLSFWTTPTNWGNTGDSSDIAPDGEVISYGGFAHELAAPAARNILTFTGTPPSIPSSGGVLLNTRLPTPITSSTAVTTEHLGLGVSNTATESEATDVVNFAYGGEKGNSTSSHYLADFIHNQPTVITYRILDADSNSFDDTLFATSNMGFFHAIDADDGSEVFSYIPKELLPNLTSYYQDAGTFSDKVYGLDAPMTVWRYDEDKDGDVVTASGLADGNDHVYIYQGMRRGGKTLYALDVTVRNSPRLLWQITGGSGGTSGFKDLGYTWSVPQRATIRTWGCTPPSSDSEACDREVLFFGGGYDNKHDTAPDSSLDEGSAIFMVDAKTGELLWSAGKSGHTFTSNKMNNSFTANVTPADITGDGYVDFIFAVDILGSVWRFDVDFEATGKNTFAKGGIVAELGGTGDDLRRFYNAPDVSYQRARGEAAYLSIAIGSGYRASPRDETINDSLFVVYDDHAFTTPDNYSYTVNVSDLAAINTSQLTDRAAASFTKGWYFPLDASEGEKILSKTVTFDDILLVPTFLPNAHSSCEGSTGIGRYYLIDLVRGKSVLKDDAGNLQVFSQLQHGGVPPDPAIIFTQRCKEGCGDGETPIYEPDLVACIGTECIDDSDFDLSLHRTYWREN
ncbi:PilC/PilY family type IV pilus protein [Oceanicoccus sagamiensis]|uniref:VWFA domain-containing protein n=1 Tax=Oceanicoccus sagamiensis TaxID=716816 RepID=A0A1X9NI12_9GAMM|nr:PilC/PilY family type IV pilus protein [Oceanicoccus sagamiensis]ARN75475.1 hypothetical protein BST96_15975 [Oceanicoccus sagamiensis]